MKLKIDEESFTKLTGKEIQKPQPKTMNEMYGDGSNHIACTIDDIMNQKISNKSKAEYLKTLFELRHLRYGTRIVSVGIYYEQKEQLAKLNKGSINSLVQTAVDIFLKKGDEKHG